MGGGGGGAGAVRLAAEMVRPRWWVDLGWGPRVSEWGWGLSWQSEALGRTGVESGSGVRKAREQAGHP